MESRNLIVELLQLSSSKLILQKVSMVRPFLNDAERSIADLMLTEPEMVMKLTVAELADRTGTSEATVFRFCRALGYSGFSTVRDELVGAVSTLRSVPNELRGNRDGWDERVYNAVQMIVNTYTALDEGSVQASAEAIARSLHVSVCGMGPISARLTEMLTFSLQRCGIPSFAWIDTRIDRLPGDFIGPNDVAIGISHSGTNLEVANFLTKAKDNGARTIAITNYSASRVAKCSDHVLCTGIIESSFQMLDLAPRISQLLVLQYLIDKVGMLKRSTGDVVQTNGREETKAN
jgi:DNA-binding MurR/RpiR family transcriptional regulator